MALTQTEVSQLYVSIFGRASEGSGNTYWQETGLDMQAAATEMLATDAAATYFGTSLDDDQAFIEHIYLNTLGKTYADDTAGVDYWVSALADGNSRGFVVSELIAAAQDPKNAGAAQDQFNNKVAVSDYCADNIETADIADLTAFAGYIDSVTDDATTVTAAQASVDADVVVPGEIFTLTTGVDIFEGGNGDDVLTATNLTMLSGDILAGGDGTDTLNLTVAAAPASAATVTGFEAINVEVNAFDGAFDALDATNITDATITVDSAKLGYNGVAQVANAKTNDVVAGANVSSLSVTGVTTGSVDTGSATTVAVTAAADTNDTDITVNGDIDLTVTTETDINLEATTASTVTLTAAAMTDLTITGEDVTLEITAADVNANTVTGAAAVVVGTAANVDLSDVDAADITLDDNFSGNTVTVATGAVLTLAETQTALTVDGLATASATVISADDQTSLTFATLDAATVSLTKADATVGTLVTGGADVTVNVAADSVISTLTAGSDDVVVTGAGDLEITTSNAATLDASAFTGELDYTSTVSADITLGSGIADVTVADADTSVTGGAGDDEVDATATTGNVIAFVGGAGENTLILTAATDVVVFDGTLGTDTIELTDGADLTGMTETLVAVEAITVQENDGSDSTANINASTLSGATYSVTGLNADAETGVDEDALNLTVTVDQATVNLGDLTLSNVDTVAIDASALGKAVTVTGTSTADTITTVDTFADTVSAGAGNDIINASTGANTLTGGTGDNIFVFAAADSLEAAMTSITDYVGAAVSTTADNDTLDISAGAIAGAGAGVLQVVADVVAGDALDGVSADANASSTLSANDINIVVTDGMISLSGLSADVAVIDTLAEWIDIAEIALVNGEVISGGALADVAVLTVAFEFDGNTYVVSALDDDGAVGSVATDNIIELTGVTGMDAVSTTAAADTIFIA